MKSQRPVVLQDQINKLRPQLEAYENLCAEIGHDPALVAIAWLLRNPVITSPVLGPRTIEQLTTNLKALDVRLSDEVIIKLDEIWPAPGGEAPETYAW